MPAKNPRLSQIYPQEMEDLDKLMTAFRSKIGAVSSKKLRPGSRPERLLNQIREQLERARKEFDALMFFTVCFGMLKSGKSTLVNLLAGHEEASPTRFGQDTTLRPCLILSGDKNEIVTFHMMDLVKGDESGDSEKRCFNAVIDHLRGMIEAGELGSDYSIVLRTLPFTNDNIVKALCSKEGFGSEPLITVVRLADGSNLLNSEIAILDVPGLDSDQMKPEITRYIELLERCDLLLFIQSTVSALNHDAAKMLRDLVKRSKSSPVWLIQNRFEAQLWRNPDDVKKQDDNLAQVARQNLAKALGIKEKKIFAKQVNLGKAYDSTFRESLIRPGMDPEQLLVESNFNEVVAELSKKIDEERLIIQLANCLSELSEAASQCDTDLHGLMDWIQSEKEASFRFREDFDSLNQQFSKLSSFIQVPLADEDPSNYHAARGELVRANAERWLGHVKGRGDAWKSEVREEVVGDEFNKLMEERVREWFDHGPSNIFSIGGAFGSGVAEMFRRTVEKSHRFRELLRESKKIFSQHESPPLEEHFDDWRVEDELRYFDVEPSIPSKVAGGTEWIFWSKKIDVTTARNKITECQGCVEEAIGRYRKQLEGGEIDNWFRQYRNGQITDYFTRQIRERRNAKEVEAETASRELELISEALPDIFEELNAIKDFTQRFRNKHNLV
jgi:hypothetical protein